MDDNINENEIKSIDRYHRRLWPSIHSSNQGKGSMSSLNSVGDPCRPPTGTQ
jgi:hypothetical protein